jgi:hypothetical protein
VNTVRNPPRAAISQFDRVTVEPVSTLRKPTF